MPKKVKDEDIETLTLDTVAAVSINIQLIPAKNQVAIIQPAKGYEDAEGDFIPNKTLPHVPVHGAELEAFFNAKLVDLAKENPGMTIYDAVQEMILSKI